MEKKMDENKKTPEEPKQGGIKGWINSVPYRSCIMMAIVGAYLIYLGYNLITSVMAGAEGANIGFAAAGVAFILIGIFMLYVAFVGYTRYTKEKNAAAEAEKKEPEATQEEETDSEASDFPEEETPVQKKLSIAERAALANHLSDEEEPANEDGTE